MEVPPDGKTLTYAVHEKGQSRPLMFRLRQGIGSKNDAEGLRTVPR